MNLSLETVLRCLDLLPIVRENQGIELSELARRTQIPEKVIADQLVPMLMLCGSPPYMPHDYVSIWLEGDRVFFSYPPTFRTIQETLKEVKRCTQEGITINVFMLETNRHLLDFVDQMTRINHGRALYTTPDNLGQYVLVDYLTNRRRRVVS